MTGGELKTPVRAKLVDQVQAYWNESRIILPGEFLYWITQIQNGPGHLERLTYHNLLSCPDYWEACWEWLKSKEPGQDGWNYANGILDSHLQMKKSAGDWGGNSEFLPCLLLEEWVTNDWQPNSDLEAAALLPLLGYPELLLRLPACHRFFDDRGVLEETVSLTKLPSCAVCGQKTIGVLWLGGSRQIRCHKHCIYMIDKDGVT